MSQCGLYTDILSDDKLLKPADCWSQRPYGRRRRYQPPRRFESRPCQRAERHTRTKHGRGSVRGSEPSQMGACHRERSKMLYGRTIDKGLTLSRLHTNPSSHLKTGKR
jgi:hypothetical protein